MCAVSAVASTTLVNANGSIPVIVGDAFGPVQQKWLHAGDQDFYLTLRPRTRGTGATGDDTTSTHEYLRDGVTVRCRGVSPGKQSKADHRSAAIIAAQPNSTWQTAQPFKWGQTIFGSADERPYVPAPNEDAYAAMLKGFQWFRFTFHGKAQRLAYFVLDVTDRDVPFDIDVFQVTGEGGKRDVGPYRDGQFIYHPEATQSYPGLYKFRTRILRPGQTYYLRVAANHPAYQIHTYDYPVPPYRDPRQAVKTGMDFLINLGDSWQSNVPRRGAVGLRTAMPYAETQLASPVIRPSSPRVAISPLSRTATPRASGRRSSS